MDSVFDTWNKYIKETDLVFSYRISKRLFYAIQGALDDGGKWFLSWVVAHTWPKPHTVPHHANMHWLVAEYALRWDDPDYLKEHCASFSVDDFTYIDRLATVHARPKLMAWFHPPVVPRMTRSMKRKADEELAREQGNVKTPRTDTE